MSLGLPDPPLMDHQRAALRKIIQTGGVCGLLMDPGLGKTRVVVTYLSMLALRHHRGRMRCFVTAPLAALDTWIEELERWSSSEVAVHATILPGSIEKRAEALRNMGALTEGRHLQQRPTVEVVITNHDSFSSRRRARGTRTVTVQDRMVTAVTEWQPDVMVVDELHRGKGRGSNFSRALARLNEVAPRRLGLTGTPAPHSPLDLFAQWRWLNPERFGTSWQPFMDTYAYVQPRQNNSGGRWDEVAGYRNLDRMSRLVRQDAIVVRKADALDLPPLTEQVVPVHLGKREEDFYRKMGKQMLAELPDSGKTVTVANQLVKLLRLRQVTGGSWADRQTGIIEDLGSSKLDVCRDLIVDLVEAGQKVVVFAHFKRDIQRLAQMCRDQDWPLFLVSGQTKKADRREQRKGFQAHDGAAVFVAQIRTMSLAVNELVAASTGIFFSLSERRDDFDQAQDRLHRMGQKNPVRLLYLTVPKSVDSWLLSAHRQKKRLENIVQRDARSVAELEAA